MRISYCKYDGYARITALETEKEKFMLERIGEILSSSFRVIKRSGYSLIVFLVNCNDFAEFRGKEYYYAKHKAQAEAREKFSAPKKHKVYWIVLQEREPNEWAEVGMADTRENAEFQKKYWKQKAKGVPIKIKQRREAIRLQEV